MDAEFPPESVPLAELIGCPTRRYQPAWRILPPPPEPRPPARTEALHPNGGWYDAETGRRIWRLDCDRPAPYGPKGYDASAEIDEQASTSPWEPDLPDAFGGADPDP